MTHYKTDCGIHSVSLPWSVLFPHTTFASVYQGEKCGMKPGRVQVAWPTLCLCLKLNPRVWLKPRCSSRTWGRESCLTDRSLRWRIERLHGKPLGALFSLQWGCSPDTARGVCTMYSSDRKAGVLGGWWNSDRSWLLDEAKHCSCNESCCTVVRLPCSCSSLMSPSAEGQENIKPWDCEHFFNCKDG
jgi:hypothetical protein